MIRKHNFVFDIHRGARYASGSTDRDLKSDSCEIQVESSQSAFETDVQGSATLNKHPE